MIIIDKSEKKLRTLKDLSQGEVFKFKDSAYYDHLYLFVFPGVLFNLTTNTNYTYIGSKDYDNIDDREVIVYAAEIHLLDHD